MFKNVGRVCTTLYRSNPCNVLIFTRSAGHSKWQNIRHVKGEKDAAKSLLFTKLARQIKVAIQEGGSDNPNKNSKLEQLIAQCKRANMPAATIQSVISSTKTDKSQCKSHLLEINGPGSCIILCQVYIDNLHAFKMTMNTILKKHKSKLTTGARHIFEEKGIIATAIPADLAHKTAEVIVDAATNHAIESGAEDVNIVDNSYLEFVCAGSDLKSVEESLEKLKYDIESASVEYIPLKVQRLGPTDLELCHKLMNKLNDLQEVIRINDNIAD